MLSLVVTPLFSIFVNYFTPLSMYDEVNLDISNWFTITIEIGAVLPIAYYFARHFFSMEQRKQQEKEDKLLNDNKKITTKLLNDILQRSSTACRYFELAWNYQDKTLDVTSHRLNDRANAEIQIIMNVHEKEIHDSYLANSSLLPTKVKDDIINLHNSNNLFKNSFNDGTTQAKIWQMWNGYLMFFGFLLANPQIRENTNRLDSFEKEFKKYIEVNDSSHLIKTCGLDKYWNTENLMEIPVELWCDRCKKKIKINITEKQRDYPFKKYNQSDFECPECNTHSLRIKSEDSQ